MRNVLLLDFDGTIIRRDTTRYLLAALLRQRPWLAPTLALPLLGILFNRDDQQLQVSKNRCIGVLLRNLDDRYLERALLEYSSLLRPLLRAQLADLIRERAGQNWLVLVVSASPDFAVSFALRGLPVNVIGTRFAQVGGRYTGTLQGAPCYGRNKPLSIREAIEDINEELRFSEAWSDSLSDLPMMAMAEKRVWLGPPESAKRFSFADPDGLFVELR